MVDSLPRLLVDIFKSTTMLYRVLLYSCGKRMIKNMKHIENSLGSAT